MTDIVNDIAHTYERLFKCVKNYKELNMKTYIALNTVVPNGWEPRYKYYVLSHINENFDIYENKKEEAQRLVDRLQKLYEDNPMDALYYENKQDMTLEDSMRNVNDLSFEEIDKLMEKIVITETNANFYHGNSYKNYLKILESGYIKTTNYSELKYPDNKIRRLHEDETGYVFVMDSLDVPLAFCFGGFRKNSLRWANFGLDEYDMESLTQMDKLDELGVIFEIDPSKYEVYFHRKEDEFFIKGDISINDVSKILFFRMDKKTGHIAQITDADLRRDGIIK